MKAHTLIYDQSTFGITGKSLKMLRNAIIDNIHDEILVVEVPTDHILCGFLIFNKNKGSVTYTGDGFRTDDGGEGGRGYKAACKLLDTFGIYSHSTFNHEAISAFKEAINNHASRAWRNQGMLHSSQKISDEFSEEDFKCYYDKIPSY